MHMDRRKDAACVLAFGLIAATLGKKWWNSCLLQMQKMIKFRTYFNTLDRWLSLWEQGKTVETYFADNQMKRIALYGMGKMGRHLIQELKTSDKVQIVYGIDRMAGKIDGEFPIYGIDEIWPPVDAVVVTVTPEFDEIADALRKKNTYPVISLDEVIGLA